MDTKKCSKCNEVKPITEFHKRSDTKSGYKSRCKTCRAVSRKNWQETYKPRRNALRQERRKTDIQYKLTSDLRRRVLKALEGVAKSKPTLELLGCSVEHLKEHLQQTAILNGYNDFDIENYSGQDYHIDHIIPCSKFDLSNPEEQHKCFHYTNLQILTAEKNIQKSDSLFFEV